MTSEIIKGRTIPLPCDHFEVVEGECEVDAVYQGLGVIVLPKVIELCIVVCASCGKVISVEETEDA